MRMKSSEEWNRKVVVEDIPVNHGDPSSLEVQIGYVSRNPCGDSSKAVVLDGIIIPEIIHTFNCHDELIHALKGMVEMFEYHIKGQPGPDDAAQRWDRARSILDIAMKKPKD